MPACTFVDLFCGSVSVPVPSLFGCDWALSCISDCVFDELFCCVNPLLSCDSDCCVCDKLSFFISSVLGCNEFCPSSELVCEESSFCPFSDCFCCVLFLSFFYFLLSDFVSLLFSVLSDVDNESII